MAGKFKVSVGEGLLSDVSAQMKAADDYKVVFIALDDIVPNEQNEGFSMEDIDELALSIREVGLEQNLVVIPFEGKYKLITGHRRFEALKRLVADGIEKWKNAPCIVKDFAKIELPLDDATKELYAMATTNAEVRDNTHADRVKLMDMLSTVYDTLKANGYEGLGKRRDFIAERLKVSPALVQQYTYIENNLADETLKELFTDNNLPLTVATEIAHLSPSAQTKLVDAYVNSDEPELSVEAVKTFAAEETARTEKKAKKKVIDELPHDLYTITKANLSPIITGFDAALNQLKEGATLDKKRYAKLLESMSVIEKQLQAIGKLFSSEK
jgi:ParB family chromosome partitioning protein